MAMKFAVWRYAAATVAVFVVGSLLGVSSVAQAEGPDSGVDTTNLATERGVPLSVVEAEIRWQEAFNAAVMEIATKFSSSYAGAAAEPESLTGLIRFTAEVPDGVEEILGDLKDSVDLVVGARFSREELDERVAKGYFAVYNSKDVANASAWVAGDNETLMLAVEFPDRVSTNQRDAIMTDLKSTSEAASGLAAKLEVVESAGELDANIYGGAYFEKPAGTAQCTTAFTVRNSSTGELGVASADHCVGAGNPLGYRTHSSSTNYNLSLRGSVGSQGWDAAWWYSASHTTLKSFYRKVNVLQTQTSWSDATLGQSVSNYGRKTGYRTSMTVQAVGACGNGYCGLTAVSSAHTQGGDSGGPWFWNGVAYGIHHGRINVAGGTRSAFSPVIRLYAINVTVYT